MTNTTSNYHPGHIIPNLLVRMQAKAELGEEQDYTQRQQNLISKLTQSLPPPTNTHIPTELIRKYSRELQAHFQHIIDSLLEGEGVCRSLEDDYVVFNDISGHPPPEKAGPQLHHFRSSTLAAEEANLRQCWTKCLTNKIPMPIHVIPTELPNGTTTKISTPYLSDIVSQQTLLQS